MSPRLPINGTTVTGNWLSKKGRLRRERRIMTATAHERFALFTWCLWFVTSLLWLRSYTSGDVANKIAPGCIVYVESSKGHILLFRDSSNAPDWSNQETHGWRIAIGGDSYVPATSIWQKVLGIGCAHTIMTSPGIMVPGAGMGTRVETKEYWLYYRTLCVAASVMPIFQLRSMAIRRSRIRHRRCPECGYDLRATPEQCPECGERVPLTRIYEEIELCPDRPFI
jgi:hypothetical protein